MRHRLTPLFFLGGGLLLAGLLWGVSSIVWSSAVAADHDGADTYLIPVDLSGERLFPITRNVVRGDPIPVCSEDYPEATKAAISWWNGDGGLGVDVFEWAGAAAGEDWRTNCPVNEEKHNRHLGVGGILVYNWDTNKDGLPDCRHRPGDNPPLGCWSTDSLRPSERTNSDWHTYFGRMLIRMNPVDFPDDWDPGSTSDCDSAAASGTDGYKCYRLVSILAHELGHALSFVDRYTVVRDAAGAVTSITCEDGGGAAIVSVMCNFAKRRDRGYDTIQSGDVVGYRAVYLPGPVAGVVASNITSDGFEIEWDAEEVHVERGVAVLWRPRDGSTNTADLQACRNPAGVWYRARLVGTPRMIGLTSVPVGYDGSTGSVTLDFGTTGVVDREYIVVANTGAIAANATAPDLETWRDVDGNGIVDGDTIQLCSHDPAYDAPGQKLSANGYAYAYGPYSRGGTSDADDSFVYVRTRPIVEISADRSTVTEADGADFTLRRYAGTDVGSMTSALAVRLSVTETGTMISGTAPSSVTIPEGAQEVSFTVPTVDDSVNEDTSDITVQINSDTEYSVSISAATVTVTDDDLPLVAVAAGSSPITEGVSAVFAVSRTGSTTSALSVDLNVSEGGGDRVASTDEGSRSVTIPAGDSSVAFTIATVDDSVVEGDSTVTVSVSSGTAYGVVSPGSASVIVNDDDTAAPVSVFLRERSTLPVTEGAPLVFEVSRGFGDPVTASLTVNVRVSELGDVVAASDVGLRSVIIAAGDRRTTFSVATVDDSVAEADSVVTVELASGTGYSFSHFDSDSVAVYDNDDLPPTVAIRAATSPIFEGDIVEFTVIHTGTATSPVTVEVEVSETGDMIYPPDKGSQSFTIPAGANSATFGTFTLNDDGEEWLNTVTVAVASGTGYSVGSPGTASVVVFSDDERGISVRPVASPISEGTAAAFTVSNEFGASRQPTTVELRVSETGDMISPTPLVSVTIPAGDLGVTFEVPTIDDGDTEIDSDVTVAILSVDGYLGAIHPSNPGAYASVTVHDNENTAPRVTISPPRFARIEGISAGFTVSRSGATSSPLVVALLVTETGDVLSGTAPTSITIPAGEASAMFEVPTADDDLDEDNSVITAEVISGADYAISTPGSASIPVYDNDISRLPIVEILQGTWDTIEGGAISFTVIRAGPRGLPLTVTLRVAETGDVLSASAPTSVTIPAGETDATFVVSTDEDAVEEDDSVVTATIVSGVGYTVGTPGSASVPVYDNDASPTIAVQPDSASTEARPARFIVSRAGSAASALTVELTITETGEMIDPAHEGSTSVTIPAGAVSATFEVPTDDDDVDEDDSTVTATISPGAGYAIGVPNSASVTVYDNDDAPTVTIRPGVALATEGYAPRFIISRTGYWTSALVVDLTVTETGDMIGPDDEGPTSITIRARETSATLYVPTVDDTVAEDDSTVTATITTSTRYTTGTPDSASVTTRDDDGTPTVTIRSAPFRVPEGNAARIIVHRSGPTTSPLTIELTVTETGDMVDPSHQGPTSFTIPADQITATFELPTVDDAIDEDNSTVTVTISDGGGLTIGSRNSERFTVVDNDLPTITIQPGMSPVTEGAFARFTVDRTGVTTFGMTIDLSVSETGDMIHTDDEGRTSVTFRAGETTATLDVATVDDTLAEDDSTIAATIATSTVYATGTPNSATVTANDDDTTPPTVTITAATSPIAEGDTAGFTIDRTGPTTAALTVELTVTESGDMLAPDDEGSASFMIPAGSTSATFELATVDDSLAEDDSTIAATITASADYAIGTPGSATVTANDNDP